MAETTVREPAPGEQPENADLPRRAQRIGEIRDPKKRAEQALWRAYTLARCSAELHSMYDAHYTPDCLASEALWFIASETQLAIEDANDEVCALIRDLDRAEVP